MGVITDAWWFVAAAYAVALVGTCGLVGWSWASLRRAESRLDALDDR